MLNEKLKQIIIDEAKKFDDSKETFFKPSPEFENKRMVEKFVNQLINRLITEDDFVEEKNVYSEKECRNMVFDYAQFVIKSMEGKVKSKSVGVWFEENKK